MVQIALKGVQNDVMPNWELTVSLLQSLRKLRSHRLSPRPAMAPHNSSVAAIAGPQALTVSQMQEAEQKYNTEKWYLYALLLCRQSLFEALMTKARHLDSIEWLVKYVDLTSPH